MISVVTHSTNPKSVLPIGMIINGVTHWLTEDQVIELVHDITTAVRGWHKVKESKK